MIVTLAIRVNDATTSEAALAEVVTTLCLSRNMELVHDLTQFPALREHTWARVIKEEKSVYPPLPRELVNTKVVITQIISRPSRFIPAAITVEVCRPRGQKRYRLSLARLTPYTPTAAEQRQWLTRILNG